MTYYIYWCWNGSKRQKAFTDEFESKQEWLWVIESLPYDIIDESDNECWVDYGDNDEE